MVRLQSKGMGFFHPGSERLLNDYELNLIFKYWYKNLNSKFHRLTMDWVYPAEYSHNGWHCDVVRDQLKVMILLDDVTQDNAPMYYALGSHNVKTDIELKIKHAILKYGTNHLQSLGKHLKTMSIKNLYVLVKKAIVLYLNQVVFIPVIGHLMV
jgi:hypothetical protein